MHVCLSRGVLTRRSGRRRVVSSTGRDSPFSPFSRPPNLRGIRRKGRSSTALGRRVDDDERRRRTRRTSTTTIAGGRGRGERERKRAGRRARRSSIGRIERWREGGTRARRRIRFVRSVEGSRRVGRERDDEEGRRGGTRETRGRREGGGARAGGAVIVEGEREREREEGCRVSASRGSRW